MMKIKKHKISAALGVITTLTGALLGNWEKDFLMGMLFASGLLLTTFITIGQSILEKQQEIVNKITIDEVEGQE